MLAQIDWTRLFHHLYVFRLVFAEKVWLRISTHSFSNNLSHFTLVIAMNTLQLLEPWLSSFHIRILIGARIWNTNLGCVYFGVLHSKDVDLPALEVCCESVNVKHLFQSAWRVIVVSFVVFTLSLHRLLNLSLSQLFSRLFSLITSISKPLVFNRFFFRLKQFNILLFEWHCCTMAVLKHSMEWSFWTPLHLILKWLRPPRSVSQVAFLGTGTSYAHRLLRNTPSASKLADLSTQRWWCRFLLLSKRYFDRSDWSLFGNLGTRHHVVSAESRRFI